MNFIKVIIPPDVLNKLSKKHQIEEYEVFQALECATNKRKSRGRWETTSKTLGGKRIRIYFEEYMGTIMVVSAREIQ